MPRAEYLAQMAAQATANEHAAVAKVREWGGAATRHTLAQSRLARGARRAVQLHLLVRQGSRFVLPDPLI
jgi:hypothetical protein